MMEGKWLIFLGLLWLLVSAVLALWLVAFPAAVTVSWHTETEYETAGFNILRSDELDGPYVKINNQLVVSRGNPAEGGDYEYRDDTVESGKTYYYQLEEIELDNSANTYAPLTYEATDSSLWQVVMALVTLLAGLILMAAGIRARGTKL